MYSTGHIDKKDMSDQPKPTTGDWTEENLCEAIERNGYKMVAGAINAALADLLDLLTDERARSDTRLRNAEQLLDRAQRADKQLDASEYNFGVQVDETKRLTAELERERMCHAACGVIALSNTPESLEKNRVMKPEYLSASVQDCIKAVERELALRSQLAASQAELRGIKEQSSRGDSNGMIYRVPIWNRANDALKGDTAALDAVIAAAQQKEGK